MLQGTGPEKLYEFSGTEFKGFPSCSGQLVAANLRVLRHFCKSNVCCNSRPVLTLCKNDSLQGELCPKP